MSLSGQVDRVVFAYNDVEERDHTKIIAEYVLKYIDIKDYKVVKDRWEGSFCKARNNSIAAADLRDGKSWVLIIDTDEELIPHKDSVYPLKELIKDSEGIDYYTADTLSILRFRDGKPEYGSGQNIRFYRHREGITYWYKDWHNQLNVDNLSRVKHTDRFVLHHTGYYLSKHEREKKGRERLQLFERRVKEEGLTVKLLWETAQMYLMKNDFKNALRHSIQAIKLVDPDKQTDVMLFSELLYQAAKCLLGIGWVKKARQFCEIIHFINKDFLDSRIIAANVAETDEEALEHLEYFLEHKGNRVEVLIDYNVTEDIILRAARLSAYLGQYEKAVKYYERLSNFEEKFREEVTHCYIMIGQFNRAEKLLDELPDTHKLRILFYVNSKRYREAIEYFIDRIRRTGLISEKVKYLSCIAAICRRWGTKEAQIVANFCLRQADRIRDDRERPAIFW